MYKVCNTEIKYTVENKEYTNTISTQKLQTNGATLNIVYDPSNPNDSLFKTGWRKNIAYILIAFAVFSIIAAGIRYYIVKTYKVAAAATGIGEGVSMLATPFQSNQSSNFIDSSPEMLTEVTSD